MVVQKFTVSSTQHSYLLICLVDIIYQQHYIRREEAKTFYIRLCPFSQRIDRQFTTKMHSSCLITQIYFLCQPKKPNLNYRPSLKYISQHLAALIHIKDKLFHLFLKCQNGLIVFVQPRLHQDNAALFPPGTADCKGITAEK